MINPKMTITDAAHCFGGNGASVYSLLLELGIPVQNSEETLYFDHNAAARFFQFQFSPNIIVFQILKGGTGKTSLAFEFAIRASLYGAKVLCVDLDQQGNLTQAFHQDADSVPVMIDHLAEEYSIFDSLLRVMDGIDLIPSRIENSMLDEVIAQKNLPLERVYRDPLNSLKSFYDVIVMDCPPSLGQSVAAAALAADYLISPVTPEKFALAGLESTLRTLSELEENFGAPIPFYALMNKFEPNNPRSLEAWHYLSTHEHYQGRLLPQQIRLSSHFPEASSFAGSIFNNVKPNMAKEDVDGLTRALLGIEIQSVDLFQNSSEEMEGQVLLEEEESLEQPLI